MQTETQILPVNYGASIFVKLSVQDICTFPHMESVFTNLWALVYRSPFTQQNARTVSWTLKILFQYIQLPKFRCLLEKELWNQLIRKSIHSFKCNWITDCSYCNFFLIWNMTVWLFNDYFYLQFPEFAIIIGTIFCCILSKKPVLFLLLELFKENI